MTKKIVLFLFIFFISVITLYLIGFLPLQNDLNAHNKLIYDLAAGNGIWGPHFLYFGFVLLLSGFNPNMELITTIAAIVLGFSVTAKAFFTYIYLQDNNSKSWISFGAVLVIGLFFFTNMSSRPPWTHELPPITWQNSTTIFLFPVALLLFYESFRYLSSPKNSTLVGLAGLGIISILIKPNFILVFGAVFPLFSLIKFGFTRPFWKIIGVHLVFVLILLGQFYYTFEIISKQGAIAGYENVKIAIAPFKAWAKLTRSIPVSFIIWTGYPLSFLVLKYKEVKQKQLLNYGLAYFFIGFLIFILLNEETVTGSNVAAVNFLWQAIIVHYILAVICLKEHLNLLKFQKSYGWKDYVIFAVFIYFAFSGIMYLVNTVYLPSI